MNAVNRFIEGSNKTPVPIEGTGRMIMQYTPEILSTNNFCHLHGSFYIQLVGHVCPDCLRPAKEHTYSDWLMNPKTGTRTRVVDGTYVEREGDDIVRFEDDIRDCTCGWSLLPGDYIEVTADCATTCKKCGGDIKALLEKAKGAIARDIEDEGYDTRI